MDMQWFRAGKSGEVVMVLENSVGVLVENEGTPEYTIEVYEVGYASGKITPLRKLQYAFNTDKTVFGVEEFGYASVYYSVIQLGHAIMAVLDKTGELP